MKTSQVNVLCLVISLYLVIFKGMLRPIFAASPSPSLSAVSSPSPSQSPSPSYSPSPSPAQISSPPLITEFMACPDSGKEEWLELFNPSDSDISILDGWKIFDATGSVYSFSSEIIEPNQFLVININTSKLNNTGDSIFLYSPAQTLVQEISYSACSKKGVSFVKQNDKWIENLNPTPGSVNVVTVQPSPQPKSTSKSSNSNSSLETIEGNSLGSATNTTASSPSPSTSVYNPISTNKPAPYPGRTDLSKLKLATIDSSSLADIDNQNNSLPLQPIHTPPDRKNLFSVILGGGVLTTTNTAALYLYVKKIGALPLGLSSSFAVGRSYLRALFSTNSPWS